MMESARHARGESGAVPGGSQRQQFGLLVPGELDGGLHSLNSLSYDFVFTIYSTTNQLDF